MTQFTALEDFFCAETQSHYAKDLSYTVRAFESYDASAWNEKQRAQVKARCDALAALLPRWLQEGKVRLGGPLAAQVNAGRVQGAGKITRRGT